jgi:hypothetical protein
VAQQDAALRLFLEAAQLADAAGMVGRCNPKP